LRICRGRWLVSSAQNARHGFPTPSEIGAAGRSWSRRRWALVPNRQTLLPSVADASSFRRGAAPDPTSARAPGWSGKSESYKAGSKKVKRIIGSLPRGLGPRVKLAPPILFLCSDPSCRRLRALLPRIRTPHLRGRFPRTVFSAASAVAKTLMCSGSPTCLLVLT
jgi:hypothetical protein